MSKTASLQNARALLFTIPAKEYFEVPGKADVLFELRDYSLDPERGAETARLEIPFLFKPFEVGQKPPPSKGHEPPFGREPTIHEYLDWTVTATSLETLDFSGFRVLTLLPRYRPLWPPPSGDASLEFAGSISERLGSPKEPVPLLMPYGRPISATTIRCGSCYVEVPFFATKQSARGKGYGKALLYAIEEICRFLGLSKILLCSTDDAATISTWEHLGFRHTLADELEEWGIGPTELVHMTNTVQMVKMVRPAPQWKSFIVQHEGFVQRLYYMPSPNDSMISKKRKEIEDDTSSKNKATRVDHGLKVEQQRVAGGLSNGMDGLVYAVNGKLQDGKTGEIVCDRDGTPESDKNNIVGSEQTKKIKRSVTMNKCADVG